MSLFSELKRRNVFRVGIAYLVVAWLVMQIADVILNNIEAPGWVFGAILLVLGIGFPFALVFSWAYELTPDGLKRDSEVDPRDSVLDDTGRRLDRAIILALVVAVMYFFWESRMAEQPVTPPPIPFPGGPGDSIQAPAATGVQPASNRSIAVLPFVNMSSNPEQEYFSDGITEEIINAVVKIPGLSVPARTTVFGYKGHQGDVRAIGRELGVAHILEGSIRSQGEQVRVTAQLIKVDDGFHMWSETFDRDLDNIFAVQEEIAAAIARQLIGELGGGVATVPNQTRNMEAYDLYLQGRAALRDRDDAAIELLTQATAADPAFAPAWAALAIAYQSTHVSITKAMEMSERALALDPDNVDALNARGSALRSLRRWLEAESHYDRALAIDPNSAELLEDYAEFLAYTGRTAEALDVTTRGMQLDPLLMPLVVAHIEALITNGEIELAEQIIREVGSGQYAPRNFWGYLSPVWLNPDRPANTGPALEPPELDPEIPETLRWLVGLLGQGSSGRLAASDIARLKELYAPVSSREGLDRIPTEWARDLLVQAGEIDHVLATDLSRFDVPGIIPMNEWMWTPLYRELRRHPRFYQYLERAGLVDYWDATQWPAWCRRDAQGDITCQ